MQTQTVSVQYIHILNYMIGFYQYCNYQLKVGYCRRHNFKKLDRLPPNTDIEGLVGAECETKKK